MQNTFSKFQVFKNSKSQKKQTTITDTKNIGNEQAKEDLAISYYQEGKIENALKLYEEILEKNPNDADLHFKIARLYYSNANREKAKYYFGKVLEIAPDYSQKEIINISLKSIEKKQNEPQKQPMNLETKKKVLSLVKKNLAKEKKSEQKEKMKAFIEKLEKEIEEESKNK